ncbi:MAG: Ethanolamine-phosphate cytidylyltransferase, partial [Paramarteilia canceri]
ISSVSRELFVGLHSKDDILENKGLPIYNLDERCKIVEQMKGVDGVIVSPYKFDLKYIEKYNLDYVMHGSDYNVVYDEAVRAKKY